MHSASTHTQPTCMHAANQHAHTPYMRTCSASLSTHACTHRCTCCASIAPPPPERVYANTSHPTRAHAVHLGQQTPACTCTCGASNHRATSGCPTTTSQLQGTTWWFVKHPSYTWEQNAAHLHHATSCSKVDLLSCLPVACKRASHVRSSQPCTCYQTCCGNTHARVCTAFLQLVGSSTTMLTNTTSFCK
jgi:hypothetical protein